MKSHRIGLKRPRPMPAMLALLLLLLPALAADRFTSGASQPDTGSGFEIKRGNYNGRSPYMTPMRRTPRPAEQAEQPPANGKSAAESQAALRTATGESRSEIDTGLVRIAKKMPPAVPLDSEFGYELEVRARECLANVVLTDHVPDGATYVRSEPAAQVNGNDLSWKWDEMDSGQSEDVKVWLKAGREGTLDSCATITADPRVCASTVVSKPMLALTKSGPESAVLGSDVTYHLVVSNPGSFAVEDVVVTDIVPDGFSHETGQRELRYKLGAIAAGRSRPFAVILKAEQRGRFCNTATATGRGVSEVKAETCTEIVKPGLSVVKTGDDMQFLTKNAKYQTEVSNTGDIPLTRVVVTDTAPAQTKIVSAEGASIRGLVATWKIEELKPGERRTFPIVLTSQAAGNHCSSVAVSSAEGPRESARVCTDWKGIPALLLEVVDAPDPIQIDEESTYTIRVTNQGTANGHNIAILAAFPDKVTPINAAAGRIEGTTVTFPSVPELAPKQTFEYTIKAKGAKVGDARLRITMNSDELETPVIEEESTRVY